MHFEILVEDASGKIALQSILEKILRSESEDHSFQIHSYKGVGRIPKGLKGTADPTKRILLDNLPRLLRGYGKAFQAFSAAVIVVVDLDQKDCLQFKQELISILDSCDPKPMALFRIAIEEGEAWLLGDRQAIQTAYPRAKKKVMERYQHDSICGTWEVLADAIHPGGSAPLKKLGFPQTGIAKCEWAAKIAPHMDIDSNQSKSFQVFRDGVRRLARIPTT